MAGHPEAQLAITPVAPQLLRLEQVLGFAAESCGRRQASLPSAYYHANVWCKATEARYRMMVGRCCAIAGLTGRGIRLAGAEFNVSRLHLGLDRRAQTLAVAGPGMEAFPARVAALAAEACPPEVETFPPYLRLAGYSGIPVATD